MDSLSIKADIVPTKFLIMDTNKLVKYKLDEPSTSSATTFTIGSNWFGNHNIWIGISDNITDVYQYRGLLVHELHHAVEFVCEEHGFEGHEFKAYLLQFLYIESMKHIDKMIKEGKIKGLR